VREQARTRYFCEWMSYQVGAGGEAFQTELAASSLLRCQLTGAKADLTLGCTDVCI
jgi:hypothetical protein